MSIMSFDIEVICEIEARLQKGLKYLEVYKDKQAFLGSFSVRHLTGEKQVKILIDNTLIALRSSQEAMERVLNESKANLDNHFRKMQNDVDRLLNKSPNSYSFKFKTIELNYLRAQLDLIGEFLLEMNKAKESLNGHD